MPKKYLGISVFSAAQERIRWTFDTFNKFCVSFSGGKDSTVMLHLVMAEAIKRNQKVAVLFIDMEGQYQYTVEHIEDMYSKYAEHIESYWVALPLSLRNAVSVYEPKWVCWEPDKDWIREPPDIAITKRNHFPFYKYAMEFEEFVPKFNKWYADDELTACFVGIRSAESLHRYRTIMGRKSHFEDKLWTTWTGKTTFNVYPIYDWKTEDIWIYHAKTGTEYNRVYDRMYQAGLSIHQSRLCQPYGDDQRKGLWLFQVLEPETWAKIVARVNGANQGALYAKESGNILGNIKIAKPPNHTWESFAKLLLASMPDITKEHYENKIAVFIRWWMDRGYNKIPDELDRKIEASKKAPSWRRICKMLLRNDYWGKGLSFSQTKSDAYQKYLKLMKKRREMWNII